MNRILLLSLLLGMLAACSPTAPQQQSLLPPTFTVDATLTPPVTELPGFSPGETRPVATVTGPDDITANFMANEVWLSDPSQSELDAFLSRWQGEILQTFDAAANGLSGIGPQYLIRVEASAADATKLPGRHQADHGVATRLPDAGQLAPAGHHRLTQRSGPGRSRYVLQL